MVSAVLTITLFAAAGPVALTPSELTIHIPSLEKTSGINRFLQRAGTHSALFRASNWEREMHPLVQVDPSDAQSLQRVGVDPKGFATLSMGAGFRMTCVALNNPALFEAAAKQTLSSWGTLKKNANRVLAVSNTETGTRQLGGYVLEKNQACSVVGKGQVDSVLKNASGQLRKPGRAPGWIQGNPEAGVYVWTPKGTAAVQGTESALEAQGQTSHTWLDLAAAGVSPYANMKNPGIALVRMRASPAGLNRTLQTITSHLVQVCPQCPAGAMHPLTKTIAAQATGELVTLILDARIRGSLRTAAGRYFAVRHGILLEVADPEQVRSVLGGLGQLKSATKTPDGWSIQQAGGDIHLGLRNKHFYIGNDLDALQGLWTQLPAQPGRTAHAAEISAHLPKLGRALNQIPLLDLLSSPEMAGAFAAGIELGPLFSASEYLTGWVDQADGKGAQKFQGRWTLSP